MPAMFRIRSIPLEVYPIFGMMSCAIAFGGFVATRKIMFDQDLRRSPSNPQYDPDHWKHRLEGKL